MPTIEAFKHELQALLEKYNASISWGCDWSSDLHGVTGEKMILETGNESITIEFVSYLDANNLKD